MHLHALAQIHNITVKEGYMGRITGLYVPEIRTIVISVRFNYETQRVALAHQLGHAILKHPLALDQPKTAEQERAADEWAAMQLLKADRYSEAAKAFMDNPRAMAAHLKVTPEIIQARVNRVGWGWA